MRNGNKDLQSEDSDDEDVLTVPMRNGNYKTPSFILTGFLVLTVPMRNGNSNFQTAPQAPSSSSYRTYEEWKLELRFSILVRIV